MPQDCEPASAEPIIEREALPVPSGSSAAIVLVRSHGRADASLPTFSGR
jgi:hypothetical protein